MDFLSTKQISQLWGITARRVTLLASQGRIKGAKQIDGRWFIPANAEKPDDPRKNKFADTHKDGEEYIFPFPLVTIYSKNQIENFSDEEKKLHHLCMIFESGDFNKAKDLAEELLKSNNKYIRLGALYHLPIICMYLSDYKEADRYTIFFRMALLDINAHEAELNILSQAFNAELESVSGFANTVDVYQSDEYSDELIPYVLVHKLLAQTYRFFMSGTNFDCNQYELICRSIESQGYFFCAMLIHLYLSMYYSAVNNTEKEIRHLKSATQIGIKHGTIFTLAFFMAINPEASIEILSSYPLGVSMQIIELTKIAVSARNGYAAYKSKALALPSLTADDARAIKLCIKRYSVKQMAEEFRLSESGMKKRLALLYAKFGVNSKREMIESYLQTSMDWGRK